jgi:hypothetical protein
LKIAPYNNSVNEEIINRYFTKSNDLKKRGDAVYEDNHITPKQTQKFKTITDLEKLLEESINNLFNRYDISYEDELSSSDLDKIKSKYEFAREIQSLASLCCYIYQPALRNDWCSLEITGRTIGLSRSKNWIIFRKKDDSVNLIMNVYKNDKHMGKQIISIKNKKLIKMLKYWISVLKQIFNIKPKYLFYYQIENDGDINIISKESFGKQIARWSSKYLGSPLTINDYRHIWEMHIQNSDEYQAASVPERKAMHAKLLHSHETGIQYNRV